jgi:hypothetical protein
MRMMRSKQILWTVLAVAAASALWVLNVELTYQRNVRHLPAAFQPRRHVITRVWNI